jgi:hypothetical protein
VGDHAAIRESMSRLIGDALVISAEV